MHKVDGEIYSHNQNGYPDDPTERELEEGEQVGYARRYAQYYVYRERDYDTIPAPDNPDRIAAVLLAIIDLEQGAFEEYFGTLCEQVASHVREEVSPPLDLPEDVYTKEFLIYQQHVYLEQSLEEIQREVSAAGSDIVDRDALEQLLNANREDFLSRATAIFGDASLSALTIEGVSGVHTRYFAGRNDDRRIEGDDPFDREPDACLELLPGDLTPELYRLYIANNLVCQIRDCYIGMGLEPPAQYRVLGPGKDEFTGKYYHFDFYPDYWDHEAAIPGYSAPLPIMLSERLE
ncbi:hypothetical protein GCM10025298_23050 [Natronobiforma cellulositropha]